MTGVTAEILAVHFRMHKAEGVLFPEALSNAATKLNVALVRVSAKTCEDDAAKRFGKRLTQINENLALLGKMAGPPWGKDQKTAALAAVIALDK